MVPAQRKQRIISLAHRLADAGVTPGIQYCGTEGCMHTGSVHSSMGNRCLVCDCTCFSTRTPVADLAVALTIAFDAEGVL